METIHHEVWINADTRTVYATITTREGLDAWWGKALGAEPRVDSVVEFEHGLGDPLRMRITDLTPNEGVAWRCLSDYSDPRNPASDWLGHRLSFDLKTSDADPAHDWLGPRLALDAAKGVTVLHFRHAGWSSASRWYAFCNWAWAGTLTTLKRYCETGDATPAGEH